MKVLITGAAGFIGHHIGNRLASADRGISVTGVDLRGPSPDVFPRFPIETKPYREILPRVLAGEFEVVVHQAAITDTRVDHSPVLHDVNVRGVDDLAVACSRSGTQLIFASSTSIYGAIASDYTAKVGDEESSALCSGPLNPYANSKLNAERHLAEVDGLHFVAFRYTNVFGPGEGAKGRMACILTQMIRRATSGVEIDVFSDTLDASRDFVPVSRVVDTVARAVMEAPNYPNGLVCNLGSGTSIRFAEIVEWLCTVAPGGRIRLNLVPNPVASRYQYRTSVYTRDVEAIFALPILSQADVLNSASELAQSFAGLEG